MALSKFKHVFDTWNYPRVYHFQRRFLDVHRRFTNVISKGPHSSIFKPKSELFDKIVHLRDMLEQPIEVHVVGQSDISVKDLVISSEDPPQTEIRKKSDKETKDNLLTIALLNIDIKDTDDNGAKDVLKMVEKFTSEGRKEIAVFDDSIIIVCNQRSNGKQSKLDEFRQRIVIDLRQNLGLTLSESQIIFPKNEMAVSAKISQVLESRIIDGFYIMKAHLEGFVRATNFKMEDVDIVETDTLVKALQGFLKNGMGFIDILEDSKSSGVSFEDLLLSNLARVMRCAILGPISMKFDLAQEACNQVAFQTKLDESMKDKISKNTRYHLTKIEKSTCELAEAITKGDTWYTFPSRDFLFIAYPLRDDIKSAVLEFEKALANLQRNVRVMKKMIFEINGNITSSQFETDETSIAEIQTGFSEELKKSLFQIDGVYGMGKIYGEWEVHVEDEKAEQYVKDMMDDCKLSYPVRIRRVLTKARSLAGNQVEHGISLQARSQNNSEEFKSGTLGMFADDSVSGDLYALTCGHVVNVANHLDNEVYVTDGTGERKTLGTSSPSRTVVTGQSPANLVDLAAVKVNDEFVPKCTKYMKDDDGMLKNVVLSTEHNRNLHSLHIFKYGAASELTSGIVCSAYYAIGYQTDQYVILIAPSPDIAPTDIDIVDYAKPGDSGSVNCMRDINNNKAVKVVSMLSAGGFRLEGVDETFCLSFRLRNGFDALRNRPAGLQLNVPSEDSGLPMF